MEGVILSPETARKLQTLLRRPFPVIQGQDTHYFPRNASFVHILDDEGYEQIEDLEVEDGEPLIESDTAEGYYPAKISRFDEDSQTWEDDDSTDVRVWCDTELTVGYRYLAIPMGTITQETNAYPLWIVDRRDDGSTVPVNATLSGHVTANDTRYLYQIMGWGPKAFRHGLALGPLAYPDNVANLTIGDGLTATIPWVFNANSTACWMASGVQTNATLLTADPQGVGFRFDLLGPSSANDTGNYLNVDVLVHPELYSDATFVIGPKFGDGTPGHNVTYGRPKPRFAVRYANQTHVGVYSSGANTAGTGLVEPVLPGVEVKGGLIVGGTFDINLAADLGDLNIEPRLTEIAGGAPLANGTLLYYRHGNWFGFPTPDPSNTSANGSVLTYDNSTFGRLRWGDPPVSQADFASTISTLESTVADAISALRDEIGAELDAHNATLADHESRISALE